MRCVASIISLALLVLCGCGEPSGAKPGAGKPAEPKAAAARNLPPLPDAAKPAAQAGASKMASGILRSNQPATEGPPPVREKAVVGVGKRGRDYGPGVITTPISVYFKAPQMLVFNVKIPAAMNLYYGVHGHFPKTQEEFMQKIIKENMIELPELPPGARYAYDAEKAAKMRRYEPGDPPLMVERPR